MILLRSSCDHVRKVVGKQRVQNGIRRTSIEGEGKNLTHVRDVQHREHVIERKWFCLGILFGRKRQVELSIRSEPNRLKCQRDLDAEQSLVFQWEPIERWIGGWHHKERHVHQADWADIKLLHIRNLKRNVGPAAVLRLRIHGGDRETKSVGLSIAYDGEVRAGIEIKQPRRHSR